MNKVLILSLLLILPKLAMSVPVVPPGSGSNNNSSWEAIYIGCKMWFGRIHSPDVLTLTECVHLGGTPILIYPVNS